MTDIDTDLVARVAKANDNDGIRAAIEVVLREALLWLDDSARADLREFARENNIDLEKP